MAVAEKKQVRGRQSPRPEANSPPTLQALKSAQTRARLVEATIACLVKYGFSKTTTPQVAAEANLSRGAMLHHFENGAALIKATIIELHEKRLRAFRRAADSNNEHDPAALVSTYWRQLQKPAFIAFHELALAARTNADLAAILQPLQVEFRERYRAEAVQLFPEWQSEPEKFELAMALTRTVAEGMTINLHTGAMDPSLVEPMLRLLVQQIEQFRPITAK